MRTHDANGKRTSQQAYEHFTPFGRFAAAPKWNPAVSKDRNNAAVDAGLRFLANQGHPQGKLVIYGFSAGGFNAVHLCERMAASGRQVDLLLTVDPCIHDVDEHDEFTISTPGPPVVKHFNWYQTSEGREGQHYSGRLIPGAINAPKLTPPFREGGPSPHDQMPVYSQEFVEAKIVLVLGNPARALHAFP